MRIADRADAPWDELFVFHFLCEGRDADERTADHLRRLVEGKDTTVATLETHAEDCRIIGRSLTPGDCGPLLAAWNRPEGSMAWMCWMPNHGMATLRDGRLDWWALICFQCDSARMAGPLGANRRSQPAHRFRRATRPQGETPRSPPAASIPYPVRPPPLTRCKYPAGGVKPLLSAPALPSPRPGRAGCGRRAGAG